VCVSVGGGGGGLAVIVFKILGAAVENFVAGSMTTHGNCADVSQCSQLQDPACVVTP
jgi:hypothetical protein